MAFGTYRTSERGGINSYVIKMSSSNCPQTPDGLQRGSTQRSLVFPSLFRQNVSSTWPCHRFNAAARVTPERPYVRLVVVRLTLTNLGWKIIRGPWGWKGDDTETETNKPQTVMAWASVLRSTVEIPKSPSLTIPLRMRRTFWGEQKCKRFKKN